MVLMLEKLVIQNLVTKEGHDKGRRCDEDREKR